MVGVPKPFPLCRATTGIYRRNPNTGNNTQINEHMRPQPRFLPEILAQIRDIGLKRGAVSISVAKKAVEEKLSDGIYMVRWLCWTLHDEEGKEVTPPEFRILGEGCDVEVVRSGVPKTLLGLDVYVDTDVDV